MSDEVGVRIPLEDPVQSWQAGFVGIPLIVEVKERNRELVTKTHSILREHGRVGTPEESGTAKNKSTAAEHLNCTVWFSLDHVTNDMLRDVDSSLPRIVSIKEMLGTIFMYWVGLLPFTGLQSDIFGVPCDPVSSCNPSPLTSLALFSPLHLQLLPQVHLISFPCALYPVLFHSGRWITRGCVG